ncbi:MAG TPA: hypothetical protein VFC02_17195 [Anaerolineales bacterium]|nr:hypothetical protein [Anaerolineales bacterium]
MNCSQTCSNSRGFWRVLNPPEEVDLAKLAREAVELLDARIRSKNGSVNIWPDLPTVFGDRIRLREVLENLIDNAVKYTDEGHNPIIEIGTEFKDSDQIIFVKDKVWELSLNI